MMRAAAKNFRSVTVVPSPEFYEEVLAELEVQGGGCRGDPTAARARRLPPDGGVRRRHLEMVGRSGRKKRRLSRVPHGPLPAGLVAALRREPAPGGRVLCGGGVGASSLRGRGIAGQGDLLQQPLRPRRGPYAAGGFDRGANWTNRGAVIVKHTNPCGAAVAGTLHEAYKKAFDSDPISAFGGIVALSGEVDGGPRRQHLRDFHRDPARPGLHPGGPQGLL